MGMSIAAISAVAKPLQLSTKLAQAVTKNCAPAALSEPGCPCSDDSKSRCNTPVLTTPNPEAVEEDEPKTKVKKAKKAPTAKKAKGEPKAKKEKATKEWSLMSKDQKAEYDDYVYYAEEQELAAWREAVASFVEVESLSTERGALYAVGDYKGRGEEVPVVIDIKTLRGRFIAHRFSTGWDVGKVKSLEKSGLFAVKYDSDSTAWTHELNKEDYGVDNDWVLCAIA